MTERDELRGARLREQRRRRDCGEDHGESKRVVRLTYQVFTPNTGVAK